MVIDLLGNTFYFVWFIVGMVFRFRGDPCVANNLMAATLGFFITNLILIGLGLCMCGLVIGKYHVEATLTNHQATLPIVS